MKLWVLALWILAAVARAGAGGNLVLEWNAALIEAIRAETTPPPLAVRNLAIFHRALAEAAREPEATPWLVASTAHEVAVALYPSRRARFAPLLRDTPGAETALVAGRGRVIAAAALARRSADGATAHRSYLPRTGPGAWRRTPPFFRPPELPHWPLTRPFEIDEIGVFLPPPPPALDSAEYARSFAEVKEIGGAASVTRTAEQTLIARFWSDFSFTSTPPGHWNAIARQIATERAVSWREAAVLFDALNTAMADACLVVWTAKYRYDTWRPVTAIREAAHDGNAATEPDPGWMPLLNTPPHPEYVSGHSAFSAAAAAVLRRFFGTDEIDFTIGCDALPGVTRRFRQLAAAVDEISDSRIFGGIHFRHATTTGKQCGERVGIAVAARMLPSQQ